MFWEKSDLSPSFSFVIRLPPPFPFLILPPLPSTTFPLGGWWYFQTQKSLKISHGLNLGLFLSNNFEKMLIKNTMYNNNYINAISNVFNVWVFCFHIFVSLYFQPWLFTHFRKRLQSHRNKVEKRFKDKFSEEAYYDLPRRLWLVKYNWNIVFGKKHQ